MESLRFKIKDKFWETPEACSFVLENLSGNTLFYKPGQFITLILKIEGKEYKRSYSLSSVAVKDRFPVITIKRVKNGLISEYLINNLVPGDEIDAHYPAGMFTPELHPANSRQYFLLAAGSGITPVFSILRGILSKEPRSSAVLLYSSRSEEEIIYSQKLSEIEMQNADRVQVIHILSNPSSHWQGFRGRLNQELLGSLVEELSLDMEKMFYICGPGKYMAECEEKLLLMGFPASLIKKESFNAPVSVNSGNKDTMKTVKIIYRKKEYEFQLKEHQTILSGALENNYRIPYNCASGVCTACIGKCTEGKVDLGKNESLSENEKNQGYVLTCIGIPVTEKTVIEID